MKGKLSVILSVCIVTTAGTFAQNMPLGEAIRKNNRQIFKDLNLDKLPSPKEQNASQKKFDEAHWHGLELIELVRELRQEYGIPQSVNGLLIDESILEAAEAGFLAGDVVLAVENYPVKTLNDFLKATMKVQENKKARITLWRSAHTQALTGDVSVTDALHAKQMAEGMPKQGVVATLTLVVAPRYSQLGYADMSAPPPIQPGAISPHKSRRQSCAACHVFMNTGGQLAVDAGDIVPNPPPISPGAVAPHVNRGQCNYCHMVSNKQGMPKGQTVAATGALGTTVSPPPISPGAVAPHGNRGQCDYCHVILNRRGIMPQGQPVAATPGVYPTVPAQVPVLPRQTPSPSAQNPVVSSAAYDSFAASPAPQRAMGKAGTKAKSGRFGVRMVVVAGVFALVYLLLFYNLLGRIPSFLVGATLMLILGYKFEFYNIAQAVAKINWYILLFIVGMNFITAVLNEAGFFDYVSKRLALYTQGKRLQLFLTFCLLTYVISAFIDNIATIMVVVPFTLVLAKELDFDPKPLLIGEIIASNLGGASTMIGDFPNLLIALSSGLQFHDFIIYEMPVCILMLAAMFIYMRKTQSDFFADQRDKDATMAIFTEMRMNLEETLTNKNAVKRGLLILGLAILGFLCLGPLGINPAYVALTGGIVALTISGVSRPKIISLGGWGDVGFFACLFVMVGGAEASGLLPFIAEGIMKICGGYVLAIAIVMMCFAALITAFMNAGPTAAIFIPMVLHFGVNAPDNLLWWALSLGILSGSCASLYGASGGPLASSIVSKFWKKNKKEIPSESNLNDLNKALTLREYWVAGGPVALMFLGISAVYVTLLSFL